MKRRSLEVPADAGLESEGMMRGGIRTLAMAAGLAVSAAVCPPDAEGARDAMSSTPRATAASVRAVGLPVAFERHAAETTTRFVARLPRFTATLSGASAVFSGADTVRMTFAGTEHTSPAGRAATGGRTTTFRGGSTESAPHFARVETTNLYPGIGLVWRFDAERRLTYDLVVAPHVDPARIEFDFADARSVRLAADGTLRVATASGEFTQSRPVCWQERGSERSFVEGGFVVRGSRIGFALGAYDPARTLVIDPTVEWSGHFGDPQTYSHAIAVDAAGAAFVAGYTRSPAFPTQDGPVAAKEGDVFVAKIVPGGARLEWTAVLSGAAFEEAFTVAVDSQGRAVVAGRTASDDFPFAAPLVSKSPGDLAFLVKFAADGRSLVFSRPVAEQSGQSQIDAIAFDSADRVVATGRMHSEVGSFATPGAYVSPDLASQDVFVARFSADASQIEWAAALGGPGGEHATGLALDASGAVYVCGGSTPGSFPLTTDLLETSSDDSDGSEPFLAKLSADGSSLLYSVDFATESDDRLYAVAVDAAGAAYCTGECIPYSPGFKRRSVLPVTNRPVGSPATNPRGSPIVVKVNPAGDALEWSIRIGGSWGWGRGIAIDEAGGVVVAGGIFKSGPPSTIQRTGAGGSRGDVFVTRIQPDARSITYTAVLGAWRGEHAVDLALGADGRAYVTGRTEGADNPFDREISVTGSGSVGLYEGSVIAAGLAPQNVRVAMRAGAATDGPSVHRPRGPNSLDSIGVSGGHGFANRTDDFDPRSSDVVITLRAGDNASTLTIPAGDSRWRRLPGGGFAWKRPDTESETWNVSFSKKAFRVVLTQERFFAPLTAAFGVDISIGNDRGSDRRFWRKTSGPPQIRYQL